MRDFFGILTRMHESTFKSLHEVFGIQRVVEKIVSVSGEEAQQPHETLPELIAQTRALLLKLEQALLREQPVAAPSQTVALEGVFDGTQMIADDGALYPVPENYASKSKLLEGDLLQLIKTPDGRNYFKQVSRVPRHIKNARLEHIEANHGLARTDDGRGYQILLAPLRFFRVNPGEQLTLEVPEAGGTWAAVVGKIESWYTSRTSYAGTLPNV